MGLLVLSRKQDESIVINDDITITIVEIRGDKVRLGIQAPKMVPVHRREVYDAIQREKAATVEHVGLVCKPENLEVTMKLAGLKSLDTTETKE